MTVAYATLDEFRALGLPPAALMGLPEADIARAIARASAWADSHLQKRYGLPLVAWGDDLRGVVCAAAAWWVLSARRGFNPEAGADVAVRRNYEDAAHWLAEVARGAVDPAGVVDSTPTVEEDAAIILSAERRGW